MAKHLAYRSSSYTGNGANCVEAAAYGDFVSVRDSKDPAGPTIEFTRQQWTQFVDEAVNQRPHVNGAVTVSTEELELTYNGERKQTCWHLHAVESGAVLRFTAGERDAFVRGAKDGEFGCSRLATPATT